MQKIANSIFLYLFSLNQLSKILIVLLVDLIILLISFLLVYFSFALLEVVSISAYRLLIFSFIIYTLLFTLSDLYKINFRYIGIDNIRYQLLVLIIFSIIYNISSIIFQNQILFILSLLHCFIFLSFLLFSRIFFTFIYSLTFEKKNKVLIFGSGKKGRRLQNFLIDYEILGFIDEDPNKINKMIDSTKVYSTSEIDFLFSKNNINQVFIAINNLNLFERRRILKFFLNKKVQIKIYNANNKNTNVSNTIDLSSFIPVQSEDIINREIKWNKSKTANLINNKVILITGGGGSIGSEITRQVSQLNPKKVIIIDNSEFNLFKIKKEINEDYPHIAIEVYLLSITDINLVKNLFTKTRPNIIFHSAAYKHVPLLENYENIISGAQNNIIGTKNIIDCFVDYKCEKILIISTDKAIKPINNMGLTKRIAELYSLNKKTDSNQEISIVRFGNVIGSSGSVMPLFNEQIFNGGPVTVTHPEATRYFMHIFEAVGLSLYALTMNKKGNIFVLNMGKPIKIIDIAKKLIQLSGLQIKNGADGDIEIKFIGLREGEKMHEDLFYDNETDVSEHKDIFISSNNKTNLDIDKIITDIEFYIDKNDANKMNDLFNSLKNNLVFKS